MSERPGSPQPKANVMGERDVATVQRWMTLDLYLALGHSSESFDAAYDDVGFADAWVEMCQQVRDLVALNRRGASVLSGQPEADR